MSIHCCQFPVRQFEATSYLTTWSGIDILDVHNPPSPGLISSYFTAGFSADVVVWLGHAYLSDVPDMVVLNVCEPASLSVLSRLTNTAGSGAIVVTNDLAYLTERTNLVVADIRDPHNPMVLGRRGLNNYASSLAVRNNVAYIGSGNSDFGPGALDIYNVSNPQDLTRLGHLDTGHNAPALAISGDYVYLAAESSGMKVIDVRNLTNPAQVAQYMFPRIYSSDVSISGQNAFLACSGDGLHILNVSNPANPVRISVISNYCHGVEVSGRYLFLLWGGYNFSVFDIENLAAPRLLATEASLISPQSMTVSGNYAYIPEGYAGLTVLQWNTQPATPATIAIRNISGSLRILVTGEPNRKHVVQTKSSLESGSLWLNLFTNCTPSGSFSFEHPPPPGIDTRFYRAVSF